MLSKAKRTLGFIYTHKLARRNKFRALSKFFIWQVQTALFPKKYFRKKFASKLWVHVNKGQTGMTGNLYAGLHELEDMAFLLHFLRPGDVFVDAGANVGSYSLLASGLAGSRSLTFEPLPSTYQILEKNIGMNRLEGLIQAFNIGLSSTKGTLMFSSDADTTNHVLKERNYGNSIEVPVSTLDEIISQPSTCLLKIDVEGFETEVLKGARRLLANQSLKAIIIELNGCGSRYGFDDLSIHNSLLDEGFRPASYDPFLRNLVHQDTFGNMNTIYIRDPEFINQRLASSESYQVHGIHF